MASGLLAFQKKGTQIHSVCVQLTVSCGCGSPTPIMVVWMPGVPLKPFCPACQRQILLSRFQFDIATNDGELRVGVMEVEPTIVKPS
jgi:hypothetical protein